MNPHHHLRSEEMVEQISEGRPLLGLAGCEVCEAEASSISQVLADLRRADAGFAATTDWDDLLLRSRIREALANEKPHVRSIFDRFAILRPAFVSALVAGIAFTVWSPLSRNPDRQGAQVASMSAVRLPSWTPLPDESEDEGLAVLAEWIPNEDELTIARCRAACLSGLTSQEEENLLHAVALIASRSPTTGASPL